MEKPGNSIVVIGAVALTSPIESIANYFGKSNGKHPSKTWDN